MEVKAQSEEETAQAVGAVQLFENSLQLTFSTQYLNREEKKRKSRNLKMPSVVSGRKNGRRST
jgi:hypothetical protein